MERQHFIRPKRGAGSGISKSFWSLFYWWDLVGNNTRTMPQTSSAIFSILMKQKRNILGQTSTNSFSPAPTSLVLWLMHIWSRIFPSFFLQVKKYFLFFSWYFLDGYWTADHTAACLWLNLRTWEAHWGWWSSLGKVLENALLSSPITKTIITPWNIQQVMTWRQTEYF